MNGGVRSTQPCLRAVDLRAPGPLKLRRLTWEGSPDAWSFAIYEYSTNHYADSILPGGGWTGTPQAALDCACGLYLNDPSAYFDPPKD